MKINMKNNMKTLKKKFLRAYTYNLFFINLIIIINFKFLKNIIFNNNKINVFIKYNLGCQSFYFLFKIFESFKNLFEKFIGWEIFLDKNPLEKGIDLGYENNFNLDSLIVSFASPSQEQDNNELSDNGDNGNDNEVYEDEEKVYEENYIPNKSIDKDKEKNNTQNNTQLEENNTRENYNTELVDENISNNNNVDIEEGFVEKLIRNYGFDNLASLWDKNSNNNSSSSSNNENNTNDSNANANSSYDSNSNNNENNISSSTNTNNNNSRGRFYIDEDEDEDSDSDFGDFGDE